LKKEGMEHAVLLDTERAAGCVISFLAERKDSGEAGACVKRMAGELHMMMRLWHPDTEGNAMGRMAQGLRREFPVADRIKDTIWDIDVLLRHLQEAYPRNDLLTRTQLLHKTLLLFMVFAASRPVELARMESPDPRDVGVEEARLRAIPKQRGGERTSVIIHKVSIASLCPLEALKEWLQRRGDSTSPRLFTRETRTVAAAKRSTTPSPRTGRYRELTTTNIRAAFKSLMLAAGIPERYKPYSIRHAVVTALFRRGASDEEVVAYGRWAPGSRVPRIFYFIHGTDGTWIGEKLLAEQPSLRDEAHLQQGLGEDESAEGGDEQSETDSSGASEADGCAERQRSAVLHESADREGHGHEQGSPLPGSSISPTW
jgi:hypothetical protein